jgi:hypothetical protein
VIGRALRRQSYDLNEDGLFDVEYADVLGIPFDFTAKPVVVKPQAARETIQVRAVRPERDALEIRFPRIEGYRVELPDERPTATFTADSVLELTPALVGGDRDAKRGHHRRVGGPEPGTYGGRAAVAGAVRADLAPDPAQVARAGRSAKTISDAVRRRRSDFSLTHTFATFSMSASAIFHWIAIQ